MRARVTQVRAGAAIGSSRARSCDPSRAAAAVRAPSFGVRDDDENTFSGNVAALRRDLGTYKDDDWKEWRRVVIRGLEAGEQLERDVAKIRTELPALAKQSAQDGIRIRVEALEAWRETQRGSRRMILNALGAIGLLVLGALLKRYL
jgi:hypothetical protein